MTQVVLHTDMLSPYGWTARMVAAEKGVAARVVPVDLNSPYHRELHPFGKMPVLEHDDLVVYETLAIAYYLDRKFDGPALQLPDTWGQATVLQWISMVNSYIFPVMNGLVKECTAGSWRDTPPDTSVIAALRDPLAMQLALVNESVRYKPFLAADVFTLADAFLFPLLHMAAFTPEGSLALKSAPAAQVWLERIRDRRSYAQTNSLPMEPA